MAVAVEFRTIPEMFLRLTEKFAKESRPVLMYKSDGTYKGISYSELRSKVETFAFGLSALGIERGDRVAIISENRPEWVVSDLAIVALGAVGVPLYPTMTAKQIEFIFNDAGVKAAIVSNQFQLNKVMRAYPDVKTLEKVILIAEKGPIPEPDTFGFSVVMEMGEKRRKEDPELVRKSIQSVQPEDLLTLIYTSGTTGNPKGVMLSHRNLVSNIIASAQVIEFGTDDVMLSFLPLSHSFERMAGYYTGMSCGATIAYAESVETVRDNMLEVRPTIVTTVPRLFERIYSRVMKQVDGGSPLKKKIFFWALDVGHRYAQARRTGSISTGLRLKHAVADRLVYAKLREKTGGRMKFFVSGGAALGKEFGEFFEAVGLNVIEGYGLTESSPVISVNRLDNYKFGTVGHPIPGVEVRIAPDGEILARGPNIMTGYFNNQEATRQAIDSDGWLHTGDIGNLDAEGFIHITDRKKHLFVSSGGKNIAPQPIENLFLSSKYIEQFMLIGDRRMFLTALIVPDFDALKEYADARNITYTSISDLVKDPDVNDLIDKEINKIQKDLANYERVRRFTLLEKQFSIEEGELTPTQKVRRKVIEERYGHLIDSMYEGIS
ncbi:MAG: long-chain fatty acid--CoA ligase [Bacteroidetes bacterium]|nr:long-chain fatty acid--CoA ligase [Bacteroidota bacterium]